MIKFALVLAVGALMVSPFVWAAEPQAFAKDFKFDGVGFSLVDTGRMKARALFTTVTICDFAKYVARDERAKPGRQLLVLRPARDLSAHQLQQVFRGVVRGRSGYSNAQLESFLGLLPSARTGSILHFRSNAAGKLEVFAGSTLAGSFVAPELAAAVWEGLAGDWRRGNRTPKPRGA
jgi:hypothetical protein